MTKREVLEAAARGEGCLGRCRDDEPVFILVGRDLLAAATVRDWVTRATAAGVNPDKLDDAILDALAIERWVAAHGGKIPD